MPARIEKPAAAAPADAWKVLSFRTTLSVRKRAEKIVDAVYRARGTSKWVLYQYMLEVGLERMEALYKEGGTGAVARACMAHGEKGEEHAART